MSVNKRGAGFQVYVKVGGRRVRRIVRTRAEARELEAGLRAELKAAPARGLEEALVAYLKADASQLGDQKGLRTNARMWRPFIAGKTLDDAPSVAADATAAWLKDGLLPATINRRLALLRRLLNVCLRWGWTEKALGKRIALLPGERERHVYLSREQVEAIAARMPLCGDMVRLTAFTGLRLGELMTLTAEQVSAGQITLPRTKNGDRRIVPVPKRVRHILKQIPWQVTETVRRNEWEAARKAAGLPAVRWHDLRHTYASWLAERGVSDRVMGELLGHRSAQMVRRYAHLKTDHLAKTVAGL